MHIALVKIYHGVIDVNTQVDLRFRVVKPGQARHQPFLQKGRHHADVQYPFQTILAGHLYRMIQLRQPTLHTRQEFTARLGQGNLTPVAVKQ